MLLVVAGEPRRLADRVRELAVDPDQRALAVVLDRGDVRLHERGAARGEHREVGDGRRGSPASNTLVPSEPAPTSGLITIAASIGAIAIVAPRSTSVVGTTGTPRAASSSR